MKGIFFYFNKSQNINDIAFAVDNVTRCENQWFFSLTYTKLYLLNFSSVQWINLLTQSQIIALKIMNNFV